MTTKVKTHKRKKKNGVSVVREHSRKDEKKTKSCKSCDYSKCTDAELRDAVSSGNEICRKKAAKELKNRGK